MNRIIKFRAWNKNIEKMIPPFELSEMVYEGDGWSSSTLKNMTFMQFTGLKDKNGKECFESDLIKDIYEITFKIEYRDDYYSVVAIKTENPDWKPTQLKDLKPFEIIGNIYENKDLLK